MNPYKRWHNKYVNDVFYGKSITKIGGGMPAEMHDIRGNNKHTSNEMRHDVAHHNGML